MGTKTQKLSNIVDQVVEWQSVFTGDGSTGLTAVAGRGYFINTTSGTVTVTLPASPKIGDTIQINDYAGTFGTNNVTLSRNGSNINGASSDGALSTNTQTVILVYLDSTRGWQTISNSAPQTVGAAYISATGGTVTTSGDYKIHTFTGDGCFVVSSLGNNLVPAPNRNNVDYLVVAGGGGGGNGKAGGGGAGGFRESHNTCVSGCYTASPLATPTNLTVTATTYPITVGGGGAGTPAPTTPGSAPQASDGSNSVFSTITSTGGGGGGSVDPATKNGRSGGSGGGASQYAGGGTGGSGNTPPVSPSQGNPGGAGFEPGAGGGGGGATAAGTSATCSSPQAIAGDGGAGATTSISGSPTAYSGGGGGGMSSCSPAPSPTGLGTGGTGGGGCGQNTTLPRPSCATGGTNTGGGGGGSSGPSSGPHSIAGGAGGKGIVIIRYKYQ